MIMIIIVILWYDYIAAIDLPVKYYYRHKSYKKKKKNMLWKKTFL